MWDDDYTEAQTSVQPFSGSTKTAFVIRGPRRLGKSIQF